MARFDLTDVEWSVIEPLPETKMRGALRVDDHRVLNGIFRRLRTGAPWTDSGTLRSTYGLCKPFQSLAQGSSSGAYSPSRISCLRGGRANDRLVLDPRPPARRQWSEQDGRSCCMARSRGDLTSRIHALVDALTDAGGRAIRLKPT